MIEVYGVLKNFKKDVGIRIKFIRNSYQIYNL